MHRQSDYRADADEAVVVYDDSRDVLRCRVCRCGACSRTNPSIDSSPLCDKLSTCRHGKSICCTGTRILGLALWLRRRVVQVKIKAWRKASVSWADFRYWSIFVVLV